MPPVETSDTAGGSWAQLVSPRYRRLVAISSLLFVFQQFAGINAVVFFSTKARATRTGSTQRGAHTARGTPTPHAAHMQRTCSAPAAHIAHAAQSCLPRDQYLPPAAGLCKRGRRLGGGRLHPRRRVQHRRHRVRRTAPGQARVPPLPLFPTLTTPAALATPATAATFTSPAPFTTPAACVTPTTPLIPDSRQHSSYLS